MLAYNLHLEKMADLPNLSNQGVKRQNQGDSSFLNLLQREMFTSKQVQNTTGPTDGQRIAKETQDFQNKASLERDLHAQQRAIESKDSAGNRGDTNKSEALSNQNTSETLNAIDSDDVSSKELEKELQTVGNSQNADEDAGAGSADALLFEEEMLVLYEKKAAIDALNEQLLDEEAVKLSENETLTEDGDTLVSMFMPESSLDSSIIDELSEEEQEALLQKLLTGSVEIAALHEAGVDVPENVEDAVIEGMQDSDKQLFGTPSDNALISVIDERTEAKAEKKTSQFVKTVQFENDGKSASVLMHIDSQADMMEVSGTEKSASRFQSMLAQEIKNSAAELVKTGSIILKDNNSGIINLFLKPEALGDVKIRLNVSDTVISAKIIVESQEALNAFKDSIGSLKQAFEQSGFDTGNFDLSWAGQGGSGEGKQEHNAKAHLYSENVPEYIQDDAEPDEGILALMKNALQYGTSIVNITV